MNRQGRRDRDASTQKTLYFTATLAQKPNISREFAENKQKAHLNRDTVYAGSEMMVTKTHSALKTLYEWMFLV